MRLEIKKLDKKIDLDTTIEKCTACMHTKFPGWSKEAYMAKVEGHNCQLKVTYDRQFMLFG